MGKSLEAIAAAAALGIDLSSNFSTQQWVPDTHPHLTIDRLVTEDQVIIPYRIQDFAQGAVYSKVGSDKDWQVGDNPSALRAFDRFIAIFGRTPGQAVNMNPALVDSIHAEVMDIQTTKNLKIGLDLEAKFPGDDLSAIKYSVANGKLVVDTSALPTGRRLMVKGLLIAASYADKITVG